MDDGEIKIRESNYFRLCGKVIYISDIQNGKNTQYVSIGINVIKRIGKNVFFTKIFGDLANKFCMEVKKGDKILVEGYLNQYARNDDKVVISLNTLNYALITKAEDEVKPSYKARLKYNSIKSKEEVIDF